MNSNNSTAESNAVESRDASDHEAPFPPQQISAFYEEAAGKKKKKEEKADRHEKVEVFAGCGVPTPPQLWEGDEEDPPSVDLVKKKIAYMDAAALLCSNPDDTSSDDTSSDDAASDDSVSDDTSSDVQSDAGVATPGHSDSSQERLTVTPSALPVRTQQGGQALPPEDQGEASTGQQVATAGPADQAAAIWSALGRRPGGVSQLFILEATLVSSERSDFPSQAQVTAFPSQDPSSLQASPPAIVNALPMDTAAPFWTRRSTIVALVTFLLSLALTVVLTLLISSRGVSPSGSTLTNTHLPTNLPTTSPTHSPTTKLTSAANIDPFQNLTSSTPPIFPTISTSPPLAFKQKLLPYDCSQCSPRTAMDQDYVVVTDDDTVYFYNWNGNAWYMTQSIFIGTASQDSSMPVVVSGDLTILGIPTEFDIGAVYLFQRNADTGEWIQFLRVSPTDNTYYSEFGHSIAVNGNTMVVGAPNDREGQGSVFVYRSYANEFTLETKIAPDDPSLYRFGVDIAINGRRIAVSDYEYGSNDKGAVFLYQHNSLHGSWHEMHEPFINDDCDKWFGSSLAFIQGGGIMIGCSWEDTQSGAVYYYAPSAQPGRKRLELQQKIVASDRIHYEKFGDVGTMAVDGDRMIVGTSSLFGSAYVFTKQDDTTWVEQMKVYGTDETERFGQNVALLGTKFLVAADNNVYSYTLENC